MKRDDILSWDEYFMGIALLSAGRSKDPMTQVGACIVKDKRILSIGYNGSPNSLPDEVMKWEREGNRLDTKYPYMIHAEANAILNFRGIFLELQGAKMYATLFPCNECAKLIIQAGIKEIVYLSDKYADMDDFKASRWLFNECGVKCTEYKRKSEKGKKYELNL